MSGRKNFNTLRERVIADPERRFRVEQIGRAYDAILDLAELRESHGVTQTELAKVLDVSQPNISKLENKDDLYLSTLSSYIAALGGWLELKAVFPDRAFSLALPSEAKHQKQPENINQASMELTDSARQAFQMLADRTGSLQQSNLRLTQDFFQNWIQTLQSQTEKNRQTSQAAQEQVERLERALQTLNQESTNAYAEFLNSALSFYQETLRSATQVVQNSMEAVSQATQQGVQAAGQAAQQGVQAAIQAASQSAPAATQAGQQAAEIANQTAQQNEEATNQDAQEGTETARRTGRRSSS